jgi:hypothetical protein
VSKETYSKKTLKKPDHEIADHRRKARADAALAQQVHLDLIQADDLAVGVVF